MSEIKGMAELKKAFGDLGKMAEKNQSTALKLAANEYKNDVQEGAPYKTGTLRRSIHVEPVTSSKMLVGTDLPYARRLEYGFIGPDKLGRVYNQAPRPYFRPPLDTNWQKYQKIYLEALGRA
jgi:HK97 gp10 family phage protein